MGVPVIGKMLAKTFGTRNERMVKRYLRVVDTVSVLEPDARKLTDPELLAKTDEFRKRIKGGESPLEMQPEIFSIAREAMDRSVGIRNIFNPAWDFDTSQLSPEHQQMYKDVQADIEKTEPREPTGDLQGSEGPIESWQFVDIPPALYQAVRELHPKSKPPYRARPFDVQIIGAVVLSEGRIAEMKTGEGKTIVAPLACYLAAMEDMQVHVVTVNDYLVQRDRDWTFPFFRAVGLTVGAIHPMHIQPPPEKKTAYECDVVYGTTSEFGFDYLRDNMKLTVQEQVQKSRQFAVVDEVDSTLIDEARTPLIISGSAHPQKPRYDLADQLARYLVEKQKDWNGADKNVQSCLVEISGIEGDIRNARDKGAIAGMKERMESAKKRLPELETKRDEFTQYYEVELDKKKAQATHLGITEAQKEAGVGSFYVGDNIDLPHLLEQSIKAHSVYQRDRDYVVAPDGDGEMSIIIVDQNTGRKMIGRQWSDGLHQAIEAKERVPIKEETQTMATITIQNFFKLYDRLAGMTGTADTEATEFHEIYSLDVICIPTNVPVIRNDYNDLIYLSERDKWDSIVDQIKSFHDLGRPVLVGTTSVEKSETLSDMLTKKHQVKHEVLNAKQHEREADIILGAGALGAVMIATNMAGRGTDIVLRSFTHEELIDHWKRRGICPKNVTADMPEDEIVAAVYRHMAPKELGIRKPDVEGMSDEDIRLALFRHWALLHVWTLSEGKAKGMAEAELREELDESGSCLMHRLGLYTNSEQLGGLHVVGTERHESRRIDNQLRGRSGRQGDQGSSRFFLSLDDDLMTMFAGNTTRALLSRLGMKEGDAIEHRMLTRAVEKAQRKVEERNFLIRKNILEYDEVMDVQRGIFYGTRQNILEGRDVEEIIFTKIDASVQDSVYTYLDRNYVPNCIADWVSENLRCAVDPDRIRGKDRVDLHRIVVNNAKEEAAALIRVTIGEYMPADQDSSEWDFKSLADWAKLTWDSTLSTSEMREMSTADVQKTLEAAADKKLDAADLDAMDQFLIPLYGENELVKWVQNKFGGDFDPKDFEKVEELNDACDTVNTAAREAYRKRERTYPVEFALEMTTANLQRDPQQAIQQFCSWANGKYELEWTPQTLPSNQPPKLREILLEEAERWDDARIADRARRILERNKTVDEVDTWLREHVNARLTDEERKRGETELDAMMVEKLRAVMRAELTQFERWVLLQIYDQAWKDHLYTMDQIKESISFRSFSQRDPRIEFKREGAKAFEDMQSQIRERVTDLIFKGRLSAQAAPAPSAAQQAAAAAAQRAQTEAGAAAQSPKRRPPRAAQPAVAAAAAAAAESGTAAQQRDMDTANEAGAEKKKQTPVRAAPTVGRNEPCPCGSGKKFKQCHGKRA